MIKATRHQRRPRLLRRRHSLRSTSAGLVVRSTRTTTAVWLVLRCVTVTVDWRFVSAGTTAFGFGGHFFFAQATAFTALGRFRFFGCSGFAGGLFLAGSAFFACGAAHSSLFFSALFFIFAGSLLACFALADLLLSSGSSLFGFASFGFTGFGFSCLRRGLSRCALRPTSCPSSFGIFGLGFAACGNARGNARGIRGESFSISVWFHGPPPSIVTVTAHSAIITLWLGQVSGIFITVGARLATVWHLRTRRLSQRTKNTHEPAGVLLLGCRRRRTFQTSLSRRRIDESHVIGS
jgi:hypothetical protein